MKKVNLEDLKIKKVIQRTNRSTICELKNGKILKIYNEDILMLSKMIGIDTEKRILKAKKIKNVEEIIVPEEAVYFNDMFIGCTMPKAKGIDYNTFDHSLTRNQREDLEAYVLRHLKLEDIIKRANKEKIVFPDLLTCDNIFVHDGDFSFIDYDGIQIKDGNVLSVSTSLGDPEQYIDTKYMNDKLFTKELDKKSLIILFFFSAFNIDLGRVGNINPYTGQIVTLDQVFDILGLNDYDIMNKVWKIFKNNTKNEFLGEDLYNLIDNYNIKIIEQLDNNIYIKKLIKK